MSQKSIILAAVIFALLIVGMFIYANLKQTELNTKETILPSENTEPVLYPEITRIDAKHYFIDDVHTLVGEINFPTPCDLLQASSFVSKSLPEQVLISFSVINNSDDCESSTTGQRFMVEANASKDATFSVTFLSRKIELNLIPAAEGETPGEFELYIKG